MEKRPKRKAICQKKHLMDRITLRVGICDDKKEDMDRITEALHRAANNLSGFTLPDGRKQESLYDGEGLRAGVRESGVTTTFLFYQGEILAEWTQSQTPDKRYLRGHGLSQVEVRQEGSDYTYHQDEQGSTLYLTRSNGEVENHYQYDAFGNLLETEEALENHFLYTGQQYDREAGQYYLRARYYHPEIGRFTQEDTYRGDGLNLYAYCGNNPVMYYDPSGYQNQSNQSPSNCRISEVNNPNLTNVKHVNESGIGSNVPDSSRFPQTRLAVHDDLVNRGYKTTGTTDNGYVVYKHPNGNRVTIKPTGEVITTVRLPVDPTNVSPKAPKYNQRAYYDETIIPDELNDHTTGHFVGEISVDDFYPEPHKWEGEASWMGGLE